MYTSVFVHVFALKRKLCLQWLVGFFHKMELDCHVHLLFPASFTHSVLLELRICQVPALFLILLVFHCGQHLADLQAVRQSSSPYVICLRQPSAHEILSLKKLIAKQQSITAWAVLPSCSRFWCKTFGINRSFEHKLAS